MDLSVITVTWNSSDYIEKQVLSVQKSAIGLEYEQIIVDNNSMDDTVKKVEKIKNITLIYNKENRGFGKANNQAFVKSSGKYILFLNPDMEILKAPPLSQAIAYMEDNSHVGIMSYRLINKHGNINLADGPRHFPKMFDQLLILLKVPHLLPNILKKYHYADIDFTKIREVETVRGAFMIVKRELIEKRGYAFDERFFNWFEDVDLCMYAKRAGYKVIYHPEFSCIDYVGQSFAKNNQIGRQIQFTESMLVYFKKYSNFYVWIWIAVFRWIGIAMSYLFGNVSK
ncbi:MAG: glycosyltransferase family 2 protein [bacterium]